MYNKKNLQEEQMKEVRRIMKHIFYAIIQIDLMKDRAYVLQNIEYPDSEGEEVRWTDYLSRYQSSIGVKERQEFMVYHLYHIYQSGTTSYSKEISFITEDSHIWLTVEVFLQSEDGRVHATLLVRESSREHLQKQIIDTYVYNKCDYFIYLDAKKNTYEMFGRKKEEDSTLPPIVCENYSAELLLSAKNYVVPEDRMRFIHEMCLKHILEQLEEKTVHSFNCGIIDPEKGYRRKMYEFQYYDKPMQKILLSRTDITKMYLESKKKQTELLAALERACKDSLTGILNHQGIIDEVTFCLMDDNGNSAVMFIDMDNFKDVNDTLGHMEGDELLKSVAQILREEVGEEDLVGRVGGDEFLIFLRNIQSIEDVEDCASRVCKGINSLTDKFAFPISCSIGVAISPMDGEDYATLTETADKRLYCAKEKGKNQISVF